MKHLRSIAEVVAVGIVVIFGALWVAIAFVALFIYETVKPVRS